MAFRMGDVVRLKSGGPSMTVERPIGNGGLSCVWFNRTDQVHTYSSGSFAAEMLEAASVAENADRLRHVVESQSTPLRSG